MNSSNPNSSAQNRDSHMNLSILMLNFLLLLTGLLANTAVIIYNIFLNHGKTISSWLLANLALADLFVCITLYSKKIARFFLYEKKYLELFCKISRSTVYVSIFISLTMLLLVTVDRFVFIAKPLKYSTIITTRRVKAVLGFIWLTAGVQLPIVYLYTRQKEKRGKNVISCQNVKQLGRLNIILLTIPVVVIAILNYKMFKIIQGHRQRMTSGTMLHSEQEQAEPEQSEQQEHEQVQPDQGTSESLPRKQNISWIRLLTRESKVIKTFAILFVGLTCCVVPLLIIRTLTTINGSNTVGIGRRIVLELIGINSIANPFVYALRHGKYRKAYRKVFHVYFMRKTN